VVPTEKGGIDLRIPLPAEGSGSLSELLAPAVLHVYLNAKIVGIRGMGGGSSQEREQHSQTSASEFHDNSDCILRHQLELDDSK
jgi:hypothetical protein